MIEALATYFHDQGLEVYAYMGTLMIRKYVCGDVITVNWMIAREDLKYPYCEYLFDIAERYVYQLNQAIAERCAACQT
jgi:hypothetical protein